MARFASTLQLGHWCLCGPGEERTCWALNPNAPKRDWDVVATNMTRIFKDPLIQFFQHGSFGEGRVVEQRWRHQTHVQCTVPHKRIAHQYLRGLQLQASLQRDCEGVCDHRHAVLRRRSEESEDKDAPGSDSGAISDNRVKARYLESSERPAASH